MAIVYSALNDNNIIHNTYSSYSNMVILSLLVVLICRFLIVYVEKKYIERDLT